jgi:uncharacterized SAM-binding protein YcdF (DUF218 family)
MLIVKSLTTPVVWVLLLLALGLILSWQSRKKRLAVAGRFLLLAGLVLLGALSLEPVANFLSYPLESRYPPPAPEALGRLDIIVALGGGMHPAGYLRREAELDKFSCPRLCHGVRIFRQSDAGLLAFCGGPPRPGVESEAETMQTLALDLGVPREKILTETQSHNTFQNLANLARLLPPGQGRRIGLVTAAMHMRRAHAVAARQFPEDTIVPLPVYYTYDPTGWSQRGFVPTVGHLEQSSNALHEWLGLLWYRLRHR